MIAGRFGWTLYGTVRHLLPKDGDVAFCGREVWRGPYWVEPDDRPYPDECRRCQTREAEAAMIAADRARLRAR